MRLGLWALNRHSVASFSSRSPGQARQKPGQRCESAQSPRSSFLPARATPASSSLRRGPTGARGAQTLRPKGGPGRVALSSSEVGQAAWTCPAPLATTLGRGLAPPPLLLALAFHWGKIALYRLFAKNLKPCRQASRSRQQSKGRYSFSALFLKPPSIFKKFDTDATAPQGLTPVWVGSWA